MLTITALSGEILSTHESLVDQSFNDCVISGTGVISGGCYERVAFNFAPAAYERDSAVDSYDTRIVAATLGKCKVCGTVVSGTTLAGCDIADGAALLDCEIQTCSIDRCYFEYCRIYALQYKGPSTFIECVFPQVYFPHNGPANLAGSGSVFNRCTFDDDCAQVPDKCHFTSCYAIDCFDFGQRALIEDCPLGYTIIGNNSRVYRSTAIHVNAGNNVAFDNVTIKSQLIVGCAASFNECTNFGHTIERFMTLANVDGTGRHVFLFSDGSEVYANAGCFIGTAEDMCAKAEGEGKNTYVGVVKALRPFLLDKWMELVAASKVLTAWVPDYKHTSTKGKVVFYAGCTCAGCTSAREIQERARHLWVTHKYEDGYSEAKVAKLNAESGAHFSLKSGGESLTILIANKEVVL